MNFFKCRTDVATIQAKIVQLQQYRAQLDMDRTNAIFLSQAGVVRNLSTELSRIDRDRNCVDRELKKLTIRLQRLTGSI